jgi:predicted MPP superfamily phosphohydrolase
MPGQQWKWPDVKSDFFVDLDKVTKWSGKLDLVLFTGDFVFRGQEFDQANAFLAEFFKILGDAGHTPKLLAVPGNHDLRRPKRLSAALMNLANWEQQPRARRDFWDNEKSVHRKAVVKLFKDYMRWWDAQPAGSERDSYRPGPLPGDFSFTFEKDGVRLGIVGLNSTFLQFQKKSQAGKLALSAQQFHAGHKNKDGATWIKEHHACLLMTHHPRFWLNSKAQEELDQINAQGRFVVHLHGHMHEFVGKSRSLVGGDAKRSWQGDSLFGLEHYEKNDGRKEERSHGYSIGQIRIETRNTGAVRIWPRKAQKHEGRWIFCPAVGKFMPDKEKDSCTKLIPFPLIREFTGSLPAALLSTVSQPQVTTNETQILGFELPTDYQPRPAVEEPIKQWCAASSNLSTLHYVSGGSGAGKTTTLGWLFRAALKGELRTDLVPVWIQLAQARHPLEAAGTLVDSLARITPDDPIVSEARGLVAKAEQHLRQETPQLLTVARSAEVGAAVVAHPSEDALKRALTLHATSLDPKHALSSDSQAGQSALTRATPSVRGGLTQYGSQAAPDVGAVMTYGARQQVAVYSFSSAPDVLTHLARHLAAVLGGSSRKTWVMFVDTWDWAYTGFSRGAQPNPDVTSSWLADLFLPALRLQAVDVLVVAAGQIPADEICTKFKEKGFRIVTTDLEAFDEQEFRQFISRKGIQSETCVQALEECTGRNPQLTRFWFELAGEGEAPFQQLTGARQPLLHGTEWLWRQMSERMPDPLPRMFQLAAVTPAFDRELLESATGLAFSEEGWNRFKGYSLVEPLRSERLRLFHIKDVFANLLRPTVKTDDVEMLCGHAIRRLLALTDHRIHGLSPDEVAKDKELSLLLMRTALVSKKDEKAAWGIFIRETARWIDPFDQSVWKEIAGMMSPKRMDSAQRAEFLLIRQGWEDLGCKPARKSTRLIEALKLLGSAQFVPTETRLTVLWAGLKVSVQLHQWSLFGELLGVATAHGLRQHERFWDVLCQMHVARGDLFSALAILASASSEVTSARTLAKLGQFAEEILHDRSRSILLYRKSVEANVEDAGACMTLVSCQLSSVG